MAGLGSMKTFRDHRSLLKGDSSTYNSFDKAYITDYPVSRSKKKLTYKRATKLQLVKIKKELNRRQKVLNEKKAVVFIFSMVITLILANYILN